jgi:hypothetical protein
MTDHTGALHFVEVVSDAIAGQSQCIGQFLL